MSDNQLQNMKQLLHGMTLFYYNFLGPMGQHFGSIFHPLGHCRCKDFKGLSYNLPHFYRMSLQEPMKHCQINKPFYFFGIFLVLLSKMYLFTAIYKFTSYPKVLTIYLHGTSRLTLRSPLDEQYTYKKVTWHLVNLSYRNWKANFYNCG